MVKPPRETALQFVGTLLDRAVHDTVSHLWPFAIPPILLDLLGAIGLDSITHHMSVTFAFLALIDNRARTVLARSMAETGGTSLPLTAAVRYPRSLWFMVTDPLEYVPVIAFALLSLPISPVTSIGAPSIYLFSSLTYVVILAIAIPLAIVILPLTIGSLAAFIDVVADGVTPKKAAMRWWRWTFRRRYFGSTLATATIYFILFHVCSFLIDALLPESLSIRPLLIMVPAGIADTMAFLLVWHWRRAVIARELGTDIFDGRGAIDVQNTLMQTS